MYPNFLEHKVEGSFCAKKTQLDLFNRFDITPDL